MIQQAKDGDLLFDQTGVEVEVLDASIEALDLTKNKEFETMAKEGGEKMHTAVEAAMKKLNISPPGQPKMGGGGGMGMGGPPSGSMQPMPGMGSSHGGQGSGAKRSSSPYKQRRF
jgi:hypothetical protein